MDEQVASNHQDARSSRAGGSISSPTNHKGEAEGLSRSPKPKAVGSIPTTLANKSKCHRGETKTRQPEKLVFRKGGAGSTPAGPPENFRPRRPRDRCSSPVERECEELDAAGSIPAPVAMREYATGP